MVCRCEVDASLLGVIAVMLFVSWVGWLGWRRVGRPLTCWWRCRQHGLSASDVSMLPVFIILEEFLGKSVMTSYASKLEIHR